MPTIHHDDFADTLFVPRQPARPRRRPLRRGALARYSPRDLALAGLLLGLQFGALLFSAAQVIGMA